MKKILILSCILILVLFTAVCKKKNSSTSQTSTSTTGGGTGGTTTGGSGNGVLEIKLFHKQMDCGNPGVASVSNTVGLGHSSTEASNGTFFMSKKGNMPTTYTFSLPAGTVYFKAIVCCNCQVSGRCNDLGFSQSSCKSNSGSVVITANKTTSKTIDIQ